MSRAQKLQNIEIALIMIANAAMKLFRNNTGLQGPTITIATPHFTGVVRVSQDQPTVFFDTYGYTHRFHNSTQFTAWVKDVALLTPLYAASQLAQKLGADIVGNGFVFTRDNTAYYVVEVPGGWKIHCEGQTPMQMSEPEILDVFGAA